MDKKKAKNMGRTMRRAKELRPYYKPSPRAKVERMLGRKLLRGEIPVVPPSQLPRCPVPPTHVKDFEECCRDYADGKLSEADVMAKVGEYLKGLKTAPKPTEVEGTH